MLKGISIDKNEFERELVRRHIKFVETLKKGNNHNNQPQ